jgi:hypothetical protein
MEKVRKMDPGAHKVTPLPILRFSLFSWWPERVFIEGFLADHSHNGKKMKFLQLYGTLEY